MSSWRQHMAVPRGWIRPRTCDPGGGAATVSARRTGSGSGEAMKVAGFPREISDLLLDAPGAKSARQRQQCLGFTLWDDVLRDDFIDYLAEAITDAIAGQLAVRLYMDRDCTVAHDEPPLIDRLLVLLVRSDSMDTSEPAPAPPPAEVAAGRRGRARPCPAGAGCAACPPGSRRVSGTVRRPAGAPRFCFATMTQRLPRGRRHAADRSEPCPHAEPDVTGGLRSVS